MVTPSLPSRLQGFNFPNSQKTCQARASCVQFRGYGDTYQQDDARLALWDQIPSPNRLLQRLFFTLNQRDLKSKFLTTVRFDNDAISEANWQDIDRLKREKAGIIWVWPHSAYEDGFVMVDTIAKRKRHRVDGILVHSEILLDTSREQKRVPVKILEKAFSWFGFLPVNRGAENPAVKDYMKNGLSKGQWIAIAPEGEANMGYHVYPMQKGPLQAAIEKAADEPGKPIYIVPMAHIWRYDDHKEVEEKIRERLRDLNGKLDSRPSELPVSPFGSPEGIDALTRKALKTGTAVLDYKARLFRQISGFETPVNWDGLDFFDKALTLKNAGLKALGSKYGVTGMRSGNNERLEHNQVMQIRTKIWEALQHETTTDKRKELHADLERVSDVRFLKTLSDRDEWNRRKQQAQVELLANIVYQLCWMMGLGNPPKPLGRRTITVSVLKPIDASQFINDYKTLETAADKDLFAIQKTEAWLQKPIQSRIDELLATGSDQSP